MKEKRWQQGIGIAFLLVWKRKKAFEDKQNVTGWVFNQNMYFDIFWNMGLDVFFQDFDPQNWGNIFKTKSLKIIQM